MAQYRCLLQNALRMEDRPPAFAFEVICRPWLVVGLSMEKALWLWEPFPLWSA